MKLIDTASLRVEISHLERDCREIMMKMGRVGVTEELLRSYEQLDTAILRLRMELIEQLRKIVVRPSTTL